MLKIGIVIAICLVAAGCQTKQIVEMNYAERSALANEIVQRCMAQVRDPKGPEMRVCMVAEAQSENAKRRNNLARRNAALESLSDGMQAASNSYYQAGAANSRSVNCTSRPMGAGTYSTSCH